MGSIPEDLIVFLLFAAFVLSQILRAWRRKQAQRNSRPPVEVSESETVPAAEPVEPTPTPLPWTPSVVEGPRPKPPTRVRHLPAATQPDTGRFSRRKLLGDRRSLQDAIVIVTVLGPCLAQRPRDTE